MKCVEVISKVRFVLESRMQTCYYSYSKGQQNIKNVYEAIRLLFFNSNFYFVGYRKYTQI